jgi:hypothetical protein
MIPSAEILSVYVDSDAVRLYRAGKASCWHAGVLLAVNSETLRCCGRAPKKDDDDNGQYAIAMAFSCLFQHKQANRFASLDNACKDE